MKQFTTASSLWRIVVMRVLLLCMIMNILMPIPVNSQEIQLSEVALKKPATMPPALSGPKAIKSAVASAAPVIVAAVDKALCADSLAVECDKPKNIADKITADCVALEDQHIKPLVLNEPQRIKTPPAQIIKYARDFWDEADQEVSRRNINISGTKSFEMKQADISGDIGHFSSENYDSMPGFKLDQSLHLEIDGDITENSKVHAVLDDKEDEDRRFTVNINGPKWQFVMGDFPLALEGTEFALFRKEVRGIMAQGNFHDRVRSIFLFSQSKGQARREQFRGAGNQQEFRMQASPIVQDSEKVTIDGRQLSRGSDYLIDYEEGIVKLMPHLLPLEITRWIVVEYEVSDSSLAFSRNLFGTRQIFKLDEGRIAGLTWLREVDSTTAKAGANASDTAAPMQHDLVSADVDWMLTPDVSVKAETAMSILDPNRNSNESEQDKSLTGHATKLALTGHTDKTDAEVSYRRIDSKFKSVGREGGVLELGERGLVNDIMSGRAKLNYRFTDALTAFADGEKSETNLADDPALSAVDFAEANTGFVWTSQAGSRFEVRGGRQADREVGVSKRSDITRDTSAAVWDKKFGKLTTQAKVNRTGYEDGINLASDSEVVEMNFNMGAKADETFSWNTGLSRVTVEDELSPDDLRSETRNWNLDLSYEPNRVFNARGLFQWRREDDYFANSRADTEIADSQIRYEPNRDLRTQFKYKIENTSKIIRDPDLDPVKYVVPASLPNSAQEEAEILNRFENPVQKTTANFITDYRVNRYLQAYFDWRRRDLQDQKTDIKVSSNDRRTYELRYTPFEKIMLTTEYEEGFNRNHEPQTELRDNIKSLQLRHEFYAGYILDATYEEKLENDIYIDENDIFTKSRIMGLQRTFSRRTSMEFALQHNDIYSKEPAREFEKRLAVVLTPSSRSQRYRFFANHKDVSARISSNHYEGGVNFSQFIGTDTMIDGEIKRVHSSRSTVGEGYDATVVNAKMVVTF
ncbi:MAG: hypothetical protein EOM80_09815 [Erysipelotrichia bacterium]|nr:hypothetical protein [Erysipelotrichia bacterium]